MTSEESRVPLTAMTAGEQVALALKVPMSGTPWLDAMIKQARYAEFRAMQYAGFCASPDCENHASFNPIDEADKAMGLAPDQGNSEENEE